MAREGSFIPPHLRIKNPGEEFDYVTFEEIASRRFVGTPEAMFRVFLWSSRVNRIPAKACVEYRFGLLRKEPTLVIVAVNRELADVELYIESRGRRLDVREILKQFKVPRRDWPYRRKRETYDEQLGRVIDFLVKHTDLQLGKFLEGRDWLFVRQPPGPLRNSRLDLA